MRKASAPFADFRGAAGRLGRACRSFRGGRTFRGFRLGLAFEIRFGRFLFLTFLGFAQDHRLDVEVFVLIQHGRGDRAGLGRVFQVFRFLRADGFFRQGRRRLPSDACPTEESDPSGAECVGASGRAFSGG